MCLLDYFCKINLVKSDSTVPNLYRSNTCGEGSNFHWQTDKHTAERTTFLTDSHQALETKFQGEQSEDKFP